jgi:uncharacterized protein (TIGR01777 family)
MNVAIAGASGLVGSALIPVLKSMGAQITRMVRSRPKTGELEWHPNQDELSPASLAGFDTIINLAGENIAGGRWTDDQKRKIRESRINGTHLLSEAIAKLSPKPRVFICASATGIYGDRDDEVLDEQSESGGGFLAGVCREWEEATKPAIEAGIRVVNLRLGPILAREGGMLAKLLTPFKMGMGGKVGSGRQYISWIAIDDVIQAIKLAIEDASIQGALNIVSPNPVTNEEFTKTLGHVLNRPTALAIPPFAARLAFGEMADEMLLASQKVIPKKLANAGFVFKYPELEPTLKHLLA